ncbi:MAG: RNA polymerase-binding transcription factor DksA [candidate division WS2 bacterium ADurb.Bin280]|uniref:RNA polymerase-binding transcription factor DksA n=1 Tax=candidate division WS2 bacterium ADurb.Bin280 TaxID=1852829 RepID=A0A1V5SFW5_9BACT|nr:MAG: RNA polymerase-binding transcription factor DksA [candidate division WS2 bacterium ADurb.Bin280]
MFNDQFLKTQEKKIRESIERIEKDIEKREKYSDIGGSSDDNALEFEAFEENLALGKSENKKLQELKAALKKLENKEYGICAKCKGKIEEARLKLYPEAVYCATHAK